MDQKELQAALAAGGDWSDLYRFHCRAVKTPLTFSQYKAKRAEFERAIGEDLNFTTEKRIKELSEVLGL